MNVRLTFAIRSVQTNMLGMRICKRRDGIGLHRDRYQEYE